MNRQINYEALMIEIQEVRAMIEQIHEDTTSLKRFMEEYKIPLIREEEKAPKQEAEMRRDEVPNFGTVKQEGKRVVTATKEAGAAPRL